MKSDLYGTHVEDTLIDYLPIGDHEFHEVEAENLPEQNTPQGKIVHNARPAVGKRERSNRL